MQHKYKADYIFTMTSIPQLGVTYEGAQQVLEEVNSNKCDGLDGIRPAILKPFIHSSMWTNMSSFPSLRGTA